MNNTNKRQHEEMRILFYICMVCEEFFESDKKPGKIEEEWSNPALCPVCNSDEVREASSKEIQNR